MKLTVVRHGETVENKNDIIQGQMPGKLSEEGIRQAFSLAETLKDEAFDVIYCSDLRRCRDTAKPITKHHPNVPVKYSTLLREINYGSYQGKNRQELDWPRLRGTFLTGRAPGGESWPDVYERLVGFVNELYAQYSDDHILVVTHGGPIYTLRSAIGNIPLKDAFSGPIDNCSVWQFEISDPLK